MNGNSIAVREKTVGNESTKVPLPFIWAVVAICALPITLNLFGVDFASPKSGVDLGELIKNSPGKVTDAMFYKLSGAFTHALLEWSAFSAAIFTAGAMDAFHTLAAARLIEAVADNRDLIPFTWAICLIFNALTKTMDEVGRFNRHTVDKELRMVELKQEVNELPERLGEKPPCDTSFAQTLEADR
jgi:hypothetical protein